MKKRHPLKVLFIIAPLCLLQAQVWFPAVNILPGSYGVSSISVVNEEIIWAVAINWNEAFPPVPATHIPKVLRTLDGGLTWDVKDIGEAIGRISFTIQALDENTAWITTQNLGPPGGRGLFKTTDGGETWLELLNHNAGGVALHFFNLQDAVCINWLSMCVTEDGGETWEMVPSANIPEPLTDEFFVFSSTTANSFPVVGDTLWFGTNRGRIMRSPNRGLNWEVFQTGFGEGLAISSLAFSDSRNGLGVFFTHDFEFHIIRSNDGGAFWKLLPVPPALGIQEISYVPGSDSIFVGVSWANPSQTAITHDFGDTWVILDSLLSAVAVTFYSADKGWMAEGLGMDNKPDIYQWDNSLAFLKSTKELWRSVTVYPNPFRSHIRLSVDNLAVEELVLFDQSGQAVWQKQVVFETEIELLFPDMAPGVYVLWVKTASGSVLKKLIKG